MSNQHHSTLNLTSFEPVTLDPLFPHPEPIDDGVDHYHDEAMIIDPALTGEGEHDDQEYIEEEETLELSNLQKKENNRVSSLQFRTQRVDDNSALEVTIQSFKEENERLQSVIRVMGAPVNSLEHTLGELATAAVRANGLGGYVFESLQQHLENQVVDENTVPTAFDFTQGLVTSITLTKPGAGVSDPFEITRLALIKDLEETRAKIAEKDKELAALRSGRKTRILPEVPGDSEDMAAINERLSVLRDMATRLEGTVEEYKAELAASEAELREIMSNHGSEEVKTALIDIRKYVEGLLRTWKEKGTLPVTSTLPLPLAQLATTLPNPSVAPPPPSTLPKRRGRPPRSKEKPTILPPALAHLLPAPEEVKAKGEETPLRRKGVKRNREELEKDRRREEEESEMLRNLVGVVNVVTRREGSFDGIGF